MNPYYKEYSEYIKEFFPGEKIQKISVNAGFSCPNRDGRIGYGGCIYCDNSTFTPSYCFDTDNIQEQINKGKEFFRRKYPDMNYLVYFQSYTNTYHRDDTATSGIDSLRKLYYEALSVPEVKGLIIGTRPDTIDNETLSLMSEINKDKRVFVELGAETFNNRTLRLINRGHTYEDTVNSVNMLHKSGIPVGLHLIMGLPGETEQIMLESVRKAVSLPIDSLKFHHLQVIRDTSLHKMIEKGEITVPDFTVEAYLELCLKIIDIVPKSICIERFLAGSPPGKVISPKWGLKNYQFTNMLLNKLNKHKLINK